MSSVVLERLIFSCFQPSCYTQTVLMTSVADDASSLELRTLGDFCYIERLHGYGSVMRPMFGRPVRKIRSDSRCRVQELGGLAIEVGFEKKNMHNHIQCNAHFTPQLD